jgi:hypothetical protein
MPLLYLLSQGLLELYLDPLDGQGDEARAGEILRHTRLIAEKAGARFILVNIVEHVEALMSEGFFYAFCAQTDSECVDPTPLFREVAGTTDPSRLRDLFLRPNDIHYSRAGYTVVAEALRRYLTTHPTRAGAKP